MRHFPIFVDLANQRVLVSGAGETAVAKLRLLLKTDAHIEVYGQNPADQIRTWADQNRITLHERAITHDDVKSARLLYGANDDDALDAGVLKLGQSAGILTNIVDNLGASQFITPAIVDRDPVTVAIGTEGAAPVLARKIKSDIEEMLPTSLGILARIGQAFRGRAAMLPMGRTRRNFWSRFFFERGPAALSQGGDAAVQSALYDLLGETLTQDTQSGRVAIVGAGPGDPDLLTRKAANLLHEADVVIHDRLVSPEILELARREAIVIETGKTGFGASWKQDDINAEMIKHAQDGHTVVRLKGGDPVIFGRLDEETQALTAANIPFEIVPGITAASGAAANLGLSLTKRGRNSSLRVLTGHDIDGFADHDWRALARDGEGAAIYMGKRAARYISGRLMMFGANGATPVTLIENATRADQHVIRSTVQSLSDDLNAANPKGPVIMLYGIGASQAEAVLSQSKQGIV